MPTQSLGDRIKKTREARGISASQFSRLVGVTPTCVWNWERGATSPRKSALAAICKAFEVEESFLLVGDRPQPTNDANHYNNVDDILDDATAKIAALLGVSNERVRIRFEVLSEG
jgi:transcriptional regulator with XRE-family HTH domain